MRAGSDERAECVCTGKPVGQAPVGAHQSEVSTMGMVGGRKRKWWGWDGNGLRVMTMEIFLGGEQVGGMDSIGRLTFWWWFGTELVNR